MTTKTNCDCVSQVAAKPKSKDKIVVYLYGTYYENHSHSIIMMTLKQNYAEIREMPMIPNGDG